MTIFEHNPVNVYGVKRRQGKTYTLVKKEDTEVYVQWLNYFQCYVNRYYNITVKPYRGKYWNTDKFNWVVEG